MSKLSKVYVFGVSGYIGSALIKKLEALSVSVCTVGRGVQYDLSIDLDELNLSVLDQIMAGDCFVFLAAISSPEFCDKEYDYAYKINVISTGELISYLLSRGVNVLFASSDVVYGRTETAVNEDDQVNPQFAYAKMKAAIEYRFKDVREFKVMRLSYVWSLNDKFTKYLIESHKHEKEIDVYDPFIRSIISLEDVLQFIVKFTVLKDEMPGVVNLCGTQFVSREQLVHEISKHISIIYHITTPDKDFFKYRPDQILMRSVYLERVLGQNLSSIYEHIEHEFKRYIRSKND